MSNELSIVLGYVLSFVYMALVIFVGEAVQKKFDTDKEITRKCEHIATSASFAICYFFVGATYHLIIINFLAMCALGVITFAGMMKSVEREDAEKSYGLFYFGLSTFVSITVVMLLDARLVPFAAIAYYSLSLADGLAPLVARLAGKRNIPLFAPKSLVGFLTVFAVSSAVALCCNFIFALALSPLFILSLGSLAAHAELYGRRGFDNITINFAVIGYLLLNHYGFVTLAVEVTLLVSPLFTLLTARTGALTLPAAVASFCYLVISSFCGGFSVMSTICILFLIEAVISKLTTKRFNSIHARSHEKHSRGIYQIIANSAAAFVCIAIYRITGNVIFLAASVVAIAEEFADSMASDIGRLSRSAPRDIIRFKKTEAGISGGVSAVGILSALLSSFAAVSVVFAFGDIKPAMFLPLGAIAFAGTLIDSVLGSLLQSLFRCTECDALTERKEHCGAPTMIIKGSRFINNSTVNLLSGSLTAMLATAFMLVV